MISTYHGNTDGSAAEVLAVNPLRLQRKPLCGFGGMTARLGRAKDAAMLLQYKSL